jgi:hypothetical protein
MVRGAAISRLYPIQDGLEYWQRIGPVLLLQKPNMGDEEVREYNQRLRESAQIVQNVDKGFAHHVKYFRKDSQVSAMMQIEQGRFGEYGWCVFLEQGRHRCVLSGTVSGRPVEEAQEDALWVAWAELVNFEPVVGQLKVHNETFYFPEVCTHFFDEYVDQLTDISKTSICHAASEFRRAWILKFCPGVRKYVRPFGLAPLQDVPERSASYAYHAASSRRFKVLRVLIPR